MVANLTAKGRKLVTIVDPHIKRDDNYKIYKQIKDLDLFVKDRDGREFDGWCWPGQFVTIIVVMFRLAEPSYSILSVCLLVGSSSYPDFTRADMREFWATKFALDDYTGNAFLSVFCE